ncbi:TPA: DUF551 domain-containing protein [Serratia marcescens]|nr:DUF551 domain-containing protein [Serratia marcescens]
MTLTIEELKYGAEVGDLGIDVVRAVCAEALANREAQPVAWTVGGFASHDKKWAERRSAEENLLLEPLYRHPVVTGIDENHYDPDLEPGLYVAEIMTKGGAAVINGYYTAPPAPAVPKEMTIEQSYENVQTWHYANGWNACRAAMLAQPVSSGYKLNSPEIPDGWIACSEQMPELDKRVLLYFDSYDGHIEDGCIGDDGDGPYHYFFDGDSLQQEPTHWMPLPAAPEGGNDHDTRR